VSQSAPYQRSPHAPYRSFGLRTAASRNLRPFISAQLMPLRISSATAAAVAGLGIVSTALWACRVELAWRARSGPGGLVDGRG